MNAKQLLESAEEHYENRDIDAAASLVVKYREARAAGEPEPKFATGRGDSFADALQRFINTAIYDRESAAESDARSQAEAEEERALEVSGGVAPAGIGYSAPVRKRPKKKRSRNPGASGINRASLKSAVGLFRKFREAEPKRTRAVQIQLPKALMSMGRVSAIEYETTHAGVTSKYRHDFVPGSRPTLTASGKRNGLFLLGGRYHVTERGIVDLDPRGREVEDKAGEVIRSPR